MHYNPLPTVIPKQYFEHLPAGAESLGPDYRHFYCAECPNNNIIALFVRFNGGKPPVAIINKKNNQLLHKKDLPNENCFKIAISRDGNLVGTTHTGGNLEQVLVITNLVTKETQQCAFSMYEFITRSDHHTINFNKQSTHIIIHGFEYNQLDFSSLSTKEQKRIRQRRLIPWLTDSYREENPVQHHRIIPLTVNTLDPNSNNKKTLTKYCAKRSICKDLMKQITLEK
jgi:hypothetical protein